MNQILYNKDKEIKIKTKYNKKRNFFKLQFFVSSIFVIIFVSGYFIHVIYENKKEEISKKILNNYNISKLYSNQNSYSFETVYENNGTQFTVIGIIEIPDLQISYPILSEATDELLKIAPCRISGPNPNEDGNLCIAGHNYDNYKFFSKISSLNNR